MGRFGLPVAMEVGEVGVWNASDGCDCVGGIGFVSVDALRW